MYYSRSYSSASGAGVILGLLFSLGLGILMIAAQWRLFVKAGEPGWKCLVPFYNIYTWLKIVWSPSVFWGILGLSVGTSVITALYTSTMSSRYSRGGFGAILLLILLLAALVASLVLAIKMLIYIARSYGKSGGFAAGLFFLAPIFYLILAFGDSEYIGPMGIPTGTGSGMAAGDGGSGQKTSAARNSFADMATEKEEDICNQNIRVVNGIFGVIVLIGAILTIVLAMKKYSPMRGLSGSPWVGTATFQQALRSPAVPSALANTVLQHSVNLVLTLGCSFLGMVLGRTNRTAKGLAVSLGALLAFVPPIIWEALVKLSNPYSSTFSSPLLLVRALPWAGLGLLLSALLANAWKGRILPAMLAPAAVLVTFLFDSFGTGSTLLTAFNQQRQSTFNSLLYNQIFINFNISMGAALEVIQGGFNLVPVIIGMVLLIISMKKGPEKAIGSDNGGAVSEMIPAAVVCAGLLAWGISLVVSAGANASAGLSSAAGSMTSTVGRTLVIGVLSLAVTFGIHLAILRLAGRFDPRKRFSFALLFFLGACLCRTSFVTYLLFRQVGLINTVFPPALLSAFSPLPLMLTLGLVALRPRQTSACVKLALGAGFLSAACAMGEITNSSIYFSSSTGTIGMALKTVLVSSGALAESGASLRSVTPLVLGLTLIITSLPLFAGTVLCIRGAKE